MRTEDTISFYERYLAIRERVESRTLEQGMVQTFAPPASTPWHPSRSRVRGGPRRRVVTAARTAHAQGKRMAVQTTAPRACAHGTPQLALDLH